MVKTEFEHLVRAVSQKTHLYLRAQSLIISDSRTNRNVELAYQFQHMKKKKLPVTETGGRAPDVA